MAQFSVRDRRDLPGGLTILSEGLERLRWTVVSVTGTEAVNELFRFEAVVTARRDEVEQHASPARIHEVLPLQPVRLSFGDEPSEQAPLQPSTRFGMVKAAHHLGVHQVGDHQELRLRLEIVPRAWLLTQRRNSRIFQDEYLHEIVSQVLCESGVRHAWQLENHYPRRLYCTQYEETDYEFVTRLLAEEGILFAFTHDLRGRFEGGDPAKVEMPKTEGEETFEKVTDVTTKVVEAGSAAAGIVDSISAGAGTEGGETAAGVARILDSSLGMVGDAVKALSGQDEAPIIVPGGGQAGPEGGGDVFWFVDRGGLYPEAFNERAEPLRLSPEQTTGMAATHTDKLESLSRAQRTVPELVEVRDYDFRKPLLLLKENAAEGVGLGESSDAGQPLEQYEHHGEYEIPDVTDETAEVQLQQHRSDRATVDGKSRSPYVRAGHSLEVFDAERGDPSPLVAVRIEHEFHTQAPAQSAADSTVDLDGMVKACAHAVHQAARAPELGEEQLRDAIRGVLASPPDGGIVYQNFFTCVARDVPYRPPRPERVMRNVTESATVMGPVGKDIYTDRFGRVKVQFHWDREGKFNDKTSVWMRVLQPWAGAGYGFQFFPRVGMEVLVTFLGGDPDRPVVLGSLYNGTHATPEPLPERMTRSGIRTQSTPKGGGFNELSFEDQKGTERVYLHAERNFDAEINHSHGMKVKHAHTLEVGTRQHIGVEGEQLFSVGGMQATTVGGDQSSCVAGTRRDRVQGNVAARVEGNRVDEVQGVAVRTVDTDELTLVAGNRDVAVFGDCSMQVAGRANAYMQDRAYISASHVIAQAEEKITFRVGTSALQLKPDAIVIEADKLVLRGRDHADVIGDVVTMRTTQGSSVEMEGSEAQIRGTRINFTSPEREGGPLDPETHPPNVKLEFTHLALEGGGTPIANTRFVVTTPTRSFYDRESGTTNGDGEIEFHVPDGVDSVEVTLYANEQYPDLYPPDGGPLRFKVHLVESLESADELPGARMRLRNLGYQPGTDVEEEELDAATRQALLDFQLEAEKPRTGKLDESTTDELQELYGS